MLSGIRVGKKKKSKKTLSQEGPKYSTATPPAIFDNDNASVAEKLKLSLASGNPDALQCSSNDRLERAGKFSMQYNEDGKNNESVVIFSGPVSKKSEEEMSARELAVAERNASVSLDEQMIRNAVRIGKKRRRGMTGEDSDEEVETMKRFLPSHDEKSSKAAEKAKQRETHRLIEQHVQQEKITSKCAWWIDSRSFSKHRLLALGNHVSLVMAPPNASLIEGHHFYLVPIKHSSSFVDCEDDGVWDEVQRFHTALSNMYATKRKGVLLCETVMPSKSFWQTKMDVIAVPFSVLQDSPIFFKSSMMEQSEEWGTHNKVLPTSAVKPLKSVIPKNFPYFYIGWGNVSTSNDTGYAQIIESSDTRHDFGLDTISSIMDLDPIRLQRKKNFSYELERQHISAFLDGWKRFDWTSELK